MNFYDYYSNPSGASGHSGSTSNFTTYGPADFYNFSSGSLDPYFFGSYSNPYGLDASYLYYSPAYPSYDPYGYYGGSSYGSFGDFGYNFGSSLSSGSYYDNSGSTGGYLIFDESAPRR